MVRGALRRGDLKSGATLKISQRSPHRACPAPCLPAILLHVTSDPLSSPHGRWPTTQWQLVTELATGENSSRTDRILNRLCAAYDRPVLAYLHHLGFSAADAEDLRQNFFLTVIQGRRLIARADRGQGRFRDYLRKSLRHFALNALRDARAAKRGGGVPHETLDLHDERSNMETPDTIFDRTWAQTVLDRANRRLAEELAAKGKSEIWRELEPHLDRWNSPESQSVVAARLNLTATALSTELNRLRTRYQHILRALIGEIVSTPQEVDDELRYLVQLLSH